MLAIYQGRVRSDLMAELRKLAGPRAGEIAEGLGALIDGLYLREVLKSGQPDGAFAVNMALNYLNIQLKEG